ncbi:hypothetical protein M9Y10_019682 [Tritrichomonas musculus]|uniref:AB hydrolase-1 domain-containing protein n=1 Tax=Tritrichomonas musculus TaxID=1915356 RepID=A0ABR2HGY7_9EUKA
MKKFFYCLLISISALILYLSYFINNEKKVYAVQKFVLFNNNSTIGGFMFKPKNAGNKVPAVIISHGFLCNLLFSFSYVRSFTRIGFVCFIFDYPNSGTMLFSSGKFFNLKNNSFESEKSDLNTVLNYVQSIDFIDKDHISLVGCSQGGVIATMLTAERSNEINNLILFYPAFNIPIEAHKGQMMDKKFDINNPPESLRVILVVKLYKCYIESATSLDIYETIKKINQKILIVHGDLDIFVNINYSIEASKVCKNCELLVIKRGTHGFFFGGWSKAMNRTNSFLLDGLK